MEPKKASEKRQILLYTVSLTLIVSNALPFLELIREAKAEVAKAAQSAHAADGSVIRTTVLKAETPLITFRVLFRVGSVHDPSDKPVRLLMCPTADCHSLTLVWLLFVWRIY